ncbi:hypothetical protein BLA6993_07478 [Burkholderia lata]|nr:hypothetical protein BLA6993_07478 [Burkholderia lata]
MVASSGTLPPTTTWPGVAVAGGGVRVFAVPAVPCTTAPEAVPGAAPVFADSAVVATVPLPTGVTVAPVFCAKAAPLAKSPAARRAATAGEKAAEKRARRT